MHVFHIEQWGSKISRTRCEDKNWNSKIEEFQLKQLALFLEISREEYKRIQKEVAKVLFGYRDGTISLSS